MTTRTEATAADLYRVPDNGKAEIVNGEVVRMSPTGGVPGRAGGRIYRSLDDYERQTGRGYAFPDNVGFLVNLPNRKSFSPDAAFHPGPLRGGRFCGRWRCTAAGNCSSGLGSLGGGRPARLGRGEDGCLLLRGWRDVRRRHAFRRRSTLDSLERFGTGRGQRRRRSARRIGGPHHAHQPLEVLGRHLVAVQLNGLASVQSQ